MTRPVEEQSLAELFGSLASSIPNLVRDELELLKAQLVFALARLQTASALLVIATAFVMTTVTLVVVAGVSGLTVLFVSIGLEPAAAVAIAALAVATMAGAITVVLVIGARQQLVRAQAAMSRGLDAVSGRIAEEEQ
jgi:hypothetical protein